MDNFTKGIIAFGLLWTVLLATIACTDLAMPKTSFSKRTVSKVEAL